MKHKILFFGVVLVFLVSMCGCNAGKTDVSDNSDTAEISSSAGKTEVVTEYKPESDTKPTETDTEPTSEATEPAKAPTSSKNATEAKKPTESVLPKPEETKPTVSSDTKEPDKPAQPEKTTPTEQPTEETKQKTAYDYEFDIEAIRNDLISLGCSMGLTHITTDDGTAITPDNAVWATPVTASELFQGERLKRKLTDFVQSMPSVISAYGGASIENFTIYIEPLGSGSYRIYFLY